MDGPERFGHEENKSDPHALQNYAEHFSGFPSGLKLYSPYQSFFHSSCRVSFSVIAVQWKVPAPFPGQGDKIIIHPQWIVPVSIS
jgi:hypothetical protein